MFETPDDRCFLAALSDGVLRLTFNRPEFGTAMPPSAMPMLERLFRAAQADPAIRCILVEGAGKVFCAGGDLVGFAHSIEQESEARQADFARRLAVVGGLVQAVIAFDRPVVAAIRGAAAGIGLLYPLAADVAIGDESAAFVFAHQRVGLSPDGGVTMLLPQVVGERTARTLLLTAAKLDAPEAHRLGILSHIVPSNDLARESMELARRLAQAPQRAIVAAKRLVSASSSSSLVEQLAAETAAIVACVGDPDFSEGVRAFIGKRRPIFPSAV
jgi:2-(1,2-epoxy-1,2-dihydrophenyl)acetyl-CoA isomerase